MHAHDIIVIGASAGGVDALPKLVASLPADLDASVFIVLHLPAQGPDLLPQIMSRRAKLMVKNAQHGEKIRAGRVYLAPPDHHLEVTEGCVQLSRGPRENRHRPAIDTLFRSAANAYNRRVVGVILTGYLDDGTAGLNHVKIRGGVTVVQEPADAVAPSMPESALRNVKIDHRLPLAEIGPLLVRLANTRDIPRTLKATDDTEKRPMSPHDMEEKFGRPTAFVCPACNGPLWDTKEGSVLQFRCHVGHAYLPDSLLADHTESLERALWSAVRTFDEQAALVRRLAEKKFQSQAYGTDLESRARKFEADAEAIRKLLQSER